MADVEQLREAWTDRYVRPRDGVEELARFAGRVGRVVTVNWSGRALVDFADGAWYDVPASEEVLEFVGDDEAKAHEATVNSAQAHPARQG